MARFYVPVTIAIEIDDKIIDSIDVETVEEFDSTIGRMLFRKVIDLDIDATQIDAARFEYEYYPMNHPADKESL